jgi:hypothetical protein
MRLVRGLLLVLAAWVAAVLPQSATAQKTSTPEERKQWVEISQKLESNPLDEGLNKQAATALKRLIEVEDVHVALCAPLMTDLSEKKYKYSATITRQYMLASGAFVIENPDKASETKAMNLAAVESVLRTYQAILKDKPEAKSKRLDDLLKKQNEGKLNDALTQCL